jgi:hypothetical protein
MPFSAAKMRTDAGSGGAGHLGSLYRQLIQQRLRLLQIARVEALW